MPEIKGNLVNRWAVNTLSNHNCSIGNKIRWAGSLICRCHVLQELLKTYCVSEPTWICTNWGCFYTVTATNIKVLIKKFLWLICFSINLGFFYQMWYPVEISSYLHFLIFVRFINYRFFISFDVRPMWHIANPNILSISDPGL